MDEVYVDIYWQTTVVRELPGDPFAIFENWLSRYYPELAAQSVEESDTDALYRAIFHFAEDARGESLTGTFAF